MKKERFLKINSNLFYSTNKTRNIEIIIAFYKCNKWHYEAIVRDLRLNSTMYVLEGTIEYTTKNDCGIIENYIYRSHEVDFCFIHNDNDYSYFNETLDSIKYITNNIYINEIMEREDNE